MQILKLASIMVGRGLHTDVRCTTYVSNCLTAVLYIGVRGLTLDKPFMLQKAITKGLLGNTFYLAYDAQIPFCSADNPRMANALLL